MISSGSEATSPPFAVLATGGTGGHVFPALALGHALARMGITPVLWTDVRGQDYLPKDWPHPVKVVLARRRASGMRDRLQMIPALMSAAFRGLSEIKGARCVVAFGGYPSLPGAMSGLMRGVPLILHEQNATRGLANACLAKFAVRIALSWPVDESENEPLGVATGGDQDQEAFSHRVVYIGNPVRQEIQAMGEMPWTPPEARQRFRILSIGGSQGAQNLTRNVVKACCALDAAFRLRLDLDLQCRDDERDMMASDLAAAGIQADIRPFFSDMAAKYKTADLVICRAGSSSLSELAAVGRPAILVPFPYSAGQHQMANAQFYERRGAAWCVPEAELAGLKDVIQDALSNPEDAKQMAEASRRLARRTAAQDLANLCLAALKEAR